MGYDPDLCFSFNHMSTFSHNSQIQKYRQCATLLCGLLLKVARLSPSLVFTLKYLRLTFFFSISYFLFVRVRTCCCVNALWFSEQDEEETLECRMQEISMSLLNILTSLSCAFLFPSMRLFSVYSRQSIGSWVFFGDYFVLHFCSR